MSMAAASAQQQAYSAWLQSKKVFVRSDLVATTNQNVVAGWGCVAAADIEEGTILFRIPRDACFAGSTSGDTDNESVNSDKTDDPTTRDTQQALALSLLKCKKSHKPNEVNCWAPFLNLLTPQTLPWTLDDKLQTCLKGTELEFVIQNKLKRLEAEYEAIKLSWNCDENQGRECISYQEYKDACSIVASHANPWFGVSIVPYNTTLNWGDRPNVEFELDENDEDVIVGNALCNVKKGAELFQSYGNSTAELLYRCGFAPKFEDFSNDTISLFVGEIISVVERALEVKIAAADRKAEDHNTWALGLPTSLIVAHLESKIKALQKSGAIDASPWDGMEDTLTAELASPSNEFMNFTKGEKQSKSGKKRQRDEDDAKQDIMTEKERKAYDDGGISKLIGICLVLFADEDTWKQTSKAIDSIPMTVEKEDKDEDLGNEYSASGDDDDQEDEDESRSDDIAASILLSSLANLTPEQSVQLQQLALDVGMNGHDPWRALLAQVCEKKSLMWDEAIKAAKLILERRIARLNEGEVAYNLLIQEDCDEKDVLDAIQELRFVEMKLLTRALKVFEIPHV